MYEIPVNKRRQGLALLGCISSTLLLYFYELCCT